MLTDIAWGPMVSAGSSRSCHPRGGSSLAVLVRLSRFIPIGMVDVADVIARGADQPLAGR